MAILGTKCRHWVAAVVLLFLATAVQAQPLANQTRLEAIYLVKFVRFVTWPEGALATNQPIVVGILGNDRFGHDLDEAAMGETVDNHPLVIRRFHRLSEARGCQVLFIGNSERAHVAATLAEMKGQAILNVSDLDQFCAEGGMVQFVLVNNKLRFRINVAAAREGNLSISSKLLELAIIVNGPQNPDQ